MDARHWDERYQERPRLWSEGPNQFVVEEVADLEPGSALDVACGEGRNSVWLAERGWEVTGVDFSTVAMDRARRMAAEHGVAVDWVEADILEWAPAHPFDLVLVAYVHFPPPERKTLMERAVSWVSPGGRLVLVGHDVSAVGVSGPPDPDLLWDPDLAREAADGLEVIRCERRPRQTDEGETAMDTLLVAHRRSRLPALD